jgi:hypothetical protein
MLYLAKGVAATTAIEGNTLSEEDVLKRINLKKSVDIPDRYQPSSILQRTCAFLMSAMWVRAADRGGTGGVLLGI